MVAERPVLPEEECYPAELTARQAEMLHMYYDLGLTMTQVAHELGVNKSSVSRTIARGRERLRRCLQYSFYG